MAANQPELGSDWLWYRKVRGTLWIMLDIDTHGASRVTESGS